MLPWLSNSVLPCNWTLLAESASGGALQDGRVGLQTPDQEDLWASGMTGNDPRDFSVLSPSTTSALFYSGLTFLHLQRLCFIHSSVHSSSICSAVTWGKTTEQNNAPSCFWFCEGWPCFPVCCRSFSLNRSMNDTAKGDLREQSSLLLRFTIAKTLSRMYIDFTVATFADLPLNDFSSYFKVKTDCNHQRF